MERFEAALASTSRALADDAGLQIDFSSLPGAVEEALPEWPASATGPLPERLAVLRGAADAIAVKRRYHDAALHLELAPAGPLSRTLFRALEDLRIEYCAGLDLRGVAGNLAALFAHGYRLRGNNVLATDAPASLANAVVLAVRARLLATPLPVGGTALVARWQDEINRGGANIELMVAAGADQRVYGRHARRLIEGLEIADDPQRGPHAQAAETPPQGETQETAPDEGDAHAADDDGGPAHATAGGAATAGEEDTEVDGQADAGRRAGPAAEVITLVERKSSQPRSAGRDTRQGSAREPGATQQVGETGPAYHAFTTRFDEIVPARDLPGADQLNALRKQLDAEISAHRHSAVQLAGRLQNSLRTLQKKEWAFDLDDGLLDTTRLARLVADPVSPLVYKQERDTLTRDTIVSFLVDNSGSMRGQPIALAAMFVEILSAALERCQVSTEILGFTTRRWRGGRTGQSWRDRGRPAGAGRLSDLRHVIYKAAEEPWRRARQALGVMLWPDLLKENIDGEALLWAHARLQARVEQRRILVVISDGVPADDATLTANAGDYLDNHLRQVVNWIEHRSPIELLAVGIHHDVSRIYRRSVTISDIEQLGDTIAHQIIELLGNVATAARQPSQPKTLAG